MSGLELLAVVEEGIPSDCVILGNPNRYEDISTANKRLSVCIKSNLHLQEPHIAMINKQFILVPLLFVMVSTSYAATQTLCEPNETVAFSCVLKKPKKIVSICTSRKLSESTGYVQYRFGLPGKIEFVFPGKREGSQDRFVYSRYTRPMVSRISLSFKSNGYDYEIYSDQEYEVGSDPVDFIELSVTGKNMYCAPNAVGSLMSLEDVLPNDPDAWMH